jgi:hypothetical protein
VVLVKVDGRVCGDRRFIGHLKSYSPDTLISFLVRSVVVNVIAELSVIAVGCRRLIGHLKL